MGHNRITILTSCVLFVLMTERSLAQSCKDQDVIQAANRVESMIPAAYLHPPMMAIGDSMFNGMTSMTIDATRAKLSAPNQVAIALGIEQKFREVNYPRADLFNLEDELKKMPVVLLAQLGNDVTDNIRAWQNDYPALAAGRSAFAKGEPLFFDNIAIAGATSDQLLCDTAGKNDITWRGVSISTGLFNLPSNLLGWHQAINSTFILNPEDLNGVGGDPDLSNLSQMAEVRLRKPVRLLINIGSNDGVWAAGFDGQAPSQQSNEQLIQNMRMIVRLIPVETKFVYIDNLVPPSRVPNFNPLSDAEPLHICGNDKVYLSMYQTYLSLPPPTVNVTAQEACNLDLAVDKLNADIKEAMIDELAKRVAQEPQAANINLRFIDFNRLLWGYDRKDTPNGQTLDVQWGSAELQLDNRVDHPIPHSGGITGYDDMHPTLIMYGRGAQEIISSIIDPSGPEVQHPNPETPPHTIFDPSLLPQCVADELKFGYSNRPGCEEFSNGAPTHTAIDMSLQENANLILVHEALSLVGTPAAPAPTEGKRMALRSLLASYRAMSTGCMLAQTLQLMGRVPEATTQSKTATFYKNCAATESSRMRLESLMSTQHSR